MLRIQRYVEAGAVRLALSGRIQGAHLAELERAIDADSAVAGALTLDLSEVRLVERAAVTFLARCEAAGVRLVSCATYVRAWIDEERHGG